MRNALTISMNICFIFLTGHTFSQNENSVSLDQQGKKEIIDRVSASLIKSYVYGDTARLMKARLESRFSDGGYNNISNAPDFADTLTADLRGIYFDHHLSVHYAPDLFAHLIHSKQGSAEQANKEFQGAKHANFGFRKMEIYKGNIGYVALDQFYPVNKSSAKTVSSVFRFLSNTNAVIIDLRNNIGGEPEMVKRICSYLFESKTHINDLYERRTKKTIFYVTEPLAESELFKDKPFYILTSSGTFSAGEEFAYDLQVLKRAVIVGETTGGGAHPVSPIAISKGFVAFVPYARAINPITKTNWEGIGIIPDIKISSANALDEALLKIYEHLAMTSQDKNEKAAIVWQRNLLSSRLEPVNPDTAMLKAYTGSFEDVLVTFENRELYFATKSGHKSKLIPLTQTTMKRLDGDEDDIQIEFLKDANNIVNKICVHFSDGGEEHLKKTL